MSQPIKLIPLFWNTMDPNLSKVKLLVWIYRKWNYPKFTNIYITSRRQLIKMYFIIYLTIIIWWYRKCYCFPSINFAELGTVPHVGKRKISHFETGECKIHGQHLICCFQECSARCGSGTDKNEPIEGQVESLLVKDGFGSDWDGYGFRYHCLPHFNSNWNMNTDTVEY